jgi:hypothetical protein
MRRIEDFFQRASAQTLFHYTGVESLLGMARSEAIWASHVYYLNDSREIIHACDLLTRSLQRLLDQYAANAEERSLLAQFGAWSKSYEREKYCLFVFSLSEEESLLSQWRSYTPYGKGVSLALGPATLTRLIEQNELRIGRCVYEPNEQFEILSSLTEKLILSFRRIQPLPDEGADPPNTCYYHFLEQFRGEVLQVLALLKHEAFREEREWRLLSTYYPNYTVPEIKFRTGASLLVPYVELKLGSQRPIFDRVMLGPTPHDDLSVNALSMFLSNSRLSATTVNGRVPYREWGPK